MDTSSPRGSVALLHGCDLVAEMRCVAPATHSAYLLNSIQALLKAASWTLKDLNLVAVGIGPGSFTGIRIGVSAALGMAQTLSIPLAAVNSLDALAHEIGPGKGRLGIVMDAHRNQVYFAEYRSTRDRTTRLSEPGLWFPQDLDRQLGRARITLAGDGASRYAKELRITASGIRRRIRRDLFLAPAIGGLAFLSPAGWITGDYASVDPLYIRPPDALRRRAALD